MLYKSLTIPVLLHWAEMRRHLEHLREIFTASCLEPSAWAMSAEEDGTMHKNLTNVLVCQHRTHGRWCSSEKLLRSETNEFTTEAIATCLHLWSTMAWPRKVTLLVTTGDVFCSWHSSIHGSSAKEKEGEKVLLQSLANKIFLIGGKSFRLFYRYTSIVLLHVPPFSKVF